MNPYGESNPDQLKSQEDGAVNNNADMNSSKRKCAVKTLTELLPIQKVKIQNSSGELVEILAMLNTGSNTSLLSKATAKKLGLTGPKTHLTMNLAGGSKRPEISEIIGVTLVSPVEKQIKKPLLFHTVEKPCSSAKTMSKNSLEKYSHLKPPSGDLHLSGGSVDLLLGTDFADGFVDIHVITGEPGEPVAKRNCFGWYVLGQITPNEQSIQSIDVGTISVKENLDLFVQQDQLGVKPTKLCTCTENELRENKFVRSLSESTTLVDGRIQVRMPWKKLGHLRKAITILPLKECAPQRNRSRVRNALT